MADFTLHIRLDELESAEDKAKKNLDEATGSTDKPKTSKNEPQSLLKAAKTVGAIKLGQQVLSVGVNQIKYEAGRYGARTGDIAGQNRINNIMNTGSQILSVGKSGLTGAVAGATFGPWGAAIGAVTGLVTSGLQQIMNMVNRGREWEVQQQLQRTTEARASERIGQIRTDRNR